AQAQEQAQGHGELAEQHMQAGAPHRIPLSILTGSSSMDRRGRRVIPRVDNRHAALKGHGFWPYRSLFGRRRRFAATARWAESLHQEQETCEVSPC
ncbi:hypothetical protein NMF55_24430, partial [Pseudomonas aeruginosa]|nr:hypothetical protein [Pseudomonas aeruginosa]